MKSSIAVLAATVTAVSCATPAYAVVNGAPAAAGSAPYAVSIHNKQIASYILDHPETGFDPAVESMTCGGSLIAPAVVLTAAHCVMNGRGVVAAPNVFLVAHDNVLSGSHVVSVSRIVAHEGYRSTPDPVNDVALMFLSKPLGGDSTVVKVADPMDMKSDAAGQSAVVSGWGDSSGKAGAAGAPSSSLNNGRVVVSPSSACMQPSATSKTYVLSGRVIHPLTPKSPAVSSAGILCAIGVNTGGSIVDACSRDSGGPLVNQATRRLIGVVAWGRGCAGSMPAAYMKAKMFYGWIARHGGFTGMPR